MGGRTDRRLRKPELFLQNSSSPFQSGYCSHSAVDGGRTVELLFQRIDLSAQSGAAASAAGIEEYTYQQPEDQRHDNRRGSSGSQADG